MRGGLEGDVGGGRAYKSLRGTLSFYKNATVLTHEGTMRKDWRFYKAPKTFICPAASYWVSNGRRLRIFCKIIGDAA